MQVIAVSDLHGNLPPLLPECDLLTIAGDICPLQSHDITFQEKWIRDVFVPWLKEQPATHKVLVAGNHDLIFQNNPYLLPEDMGCTYLEDSGVEFDGVRVWGSPWQPSFGIGWAFNGGEEFLSRKWSLIPEDTDFLVLHGPPRGYGDLAPRRLILDSHEEEWPGGVLTGSPSLLKRIKAVRPKVAVFGHIHEGHGVYDCEGITLANVAMLDGQYRSIHSPTSLVL